MADEIGAWPEEDARRIAAVVRKVERMGTAVRPVRGRGPVMDDGRTVELGVLDGACAPDGTATFSIWDGDADTGEDLTVNNWYSAEVPAGKAMVAWFPRAQAWYIVSADCEA